MTTATASGIREATEADIPACVAMGLEFARTVAVYRDHVPVSADALVKLGFWLLEHGTILVVERDGEAVGMIGLAVMPHVMSGRLAASELFFWVQPEARGCGVRLLRAAERWAVAHGAEAMHMIAPTGDVERLYMRLGYSKIETAYLRSLACDTTHG